jgi:hypothetical protein
MLNKKRGWEGVKCEGEKEVKKKHDKGIGVGDNIYPGGIYPPAHDLHGDIYPACD